MIKSSEKDRDKGKYGDCMQPKDKSRVYVNQLEWVGKLFSLLVQVS